MKNELEALRAEVAKLREEIAALRSERVIVVGPPATNPAPIWPGYPSPLPSPAMPYSPPTWYSTCKAGFDGAGTYAVNQDGSLSRVHD